MDTKSCILILLMVTIGMVVHVTSREVPNTKTINNNQKESDSNNKETLVATNKNNDSENSEVNKDDKHILFAGGGITGGVGGFIAKGIGAGVIPTGGLGGLGGVPGGLGGLGGGGAGGLGGLGGGGTGGGTGGIGGVGGGAGGPWPTSGLRPIP